MQEYSLEQSKALDLLETDCLNRLYPNIETVDEATCDTYYVQFSKQNEVTMDDDGCGYAVVHFSDEYGVWQIWELGWDTKESSDQALASYL